MPARSRSLTISSPNSVVVVGWPRTPATARAVPAGLVVTRAGSRSPLNQANRYSPVAHNCPSVPAPPQPVGHQPSGRKAGLSSGAGAGLLTGAAGGGGGGAAGGVSAKVGPTHNKAVPRASSKRSTIASP